MDTVRNIVNPTPAGDWFSVALCSDGSYGVEKGLIFGYPVRSNGSKLEIVQNIPLNEFSKEKFDVTHKELISEREDVKEMLG